MREFLKKRWWVVLLVVIAIAGLIFFLIRSGISGKAEDPNDYAGDEFAIPEDAEIEEEDYDTGIDFEEEIEGAQLSFRSSEESEFMGSWTSTSGQAHYLYGNIDLDIEKGGKWTGNVADEDLSGSWTFDGTYLSLSSDLFNVTLAFTESGKLVMQEDRSGDGTYLNTVLTRN
ncbi:MAG: hypothetical protein IJH28_02475 [Mogibacterium sp.]|nr:hypothetical protein [Mogibacterium sp.]MBQ6501531.1 hypothetical protein [Mogibacterium sp.]